MRLHRVLTRALLGLAAAVVTLSVAIAPAAAQTSNTNPFQPKGAGPTASSGASTSATTQPAATGGTGATTASSASSATAGTGAASASTPIPTTGVEAGRSALVGLACVALGILLVLAARPRRTVARSRWDLVPVRTR